MNEAVIDRRDSGGVSRSGGGLKLGLLITAGVLVGTAVAAYVGLCAYAGEYDTFFPNTSINQVDVGGLTVDEATQKLKNTILTRKVDFYLPVIGEPGAEPVYQKEPAVSATFGELGLEEGTDFQAIVQEAFDASRTNGTFLTRGRDFLQIMSDGGGSVSTQLTPSEEVLQARAAEMAQQFFVAPKDMTYAREEETFKITKDVHGMSVDAETLASDIRPLLNLTGDQTVQVQAEITTGTVYPIQEIYDALTNPPKNAGYDKVNGGIAYGVIGADFDVGAVQKLVNDAAPGETVSVEATLTYPSITSETLRPLLFRDVLGTATTHVSGTAARVSNVKKATAACNGVVLNAGEVFSYNGTVGKRTAARGYQAAPAYVNGETVDEIGGGVCQPSSTLYLATLRSNMAIVERYEHRYTPAYIDWGLDATVSWGGPDFKFRNNTDYPIKIVSSYENGSITFKLLGTNINGYSVKMTTEVISKTSAQTVYQEDKSLPVGSTKVISTPYNGAVVKSYRNVYNANGQLISSNLEATSNYKVRNRVIARNSG